VGITQRKKNFQTVESPEILAFLILVVFSLFCPYSLFLELVDGLGNGLRWRVKTLAIPHAVC